MGKTKNKRCFNCQQPGHVAKVCPKSIIICSKCGLVGHRQATCRRSSPIKVEETNSATERLSAVAKLVKKARALVKATALFIQDINGEAEKTPDSDNQRRLLGAARTLTDANERIKVAARECVSHPYDIQYQDLLRKRAEELRDVTIVVDTMPALQARLADRVSSGTQCITATQASNQTTREPLITESQELANPEDTTNQVHPAADYVKTSQSVPQSVLPTIHEQAITEQLSVTSQNLNTDLSDLRGAPSRAKSVCEGLELGASARSARSAQFIADLRDHFRKFAQTITSELKTEGLTAFGSKTINQEVAQLSSAAARGNEIYTDDAARDRPQSPRSADEQDIKLEVFESDQEMLTYSATLLEETQKPLQSVEVIRDKIIKEYANSNPTRKRQKPKENISEIEDHADNYCGEDIFEACYMDTNGPPIGQIKCGICNQFFSGDVNYVVHVKWCRAGTLQL